MAKERALALWALILAEALSACGDAGNGSGSSGGAAGCEPSKEYACACGDGTDGTQVCNADGSSLSACSCAGMLPSETPDATGPGGTPNGAGGASLTSGAGGVSMGGTPAIGGAPPQAGGAPSGGAGGTPVGPVEGIPSASSCTGMTLPAVSEYGAMGPFGVVKVDGTGPDGQYTMFRPETLGGTNGFLHPPATWGNGIFTTPDNYQGLLGTMASHGFVIIASNSTNVTAALMTAGLDWLLQQNAAAGDLQGKLATDCAVTIGYSLGGGASIDSGDHPNVVTTVSFHGLQGAAEQLHAPLFLLTSTSDGFVTKSGFTQPTYDRSTVVPTLMATLEVPGAVPDNYGHLIPLNDAGEERAPAVAWLRFWVYGDDGARHYFYGNDCVLCQTPWIDIQRKNADWQ
jgi:hypothetical protein